MLIVGAKGFANQLLVVLTQIQFQGDITLYDDFIKSDREISNGKYTILKSEEEAVKYFKTHDRKFLLGVGSPKSRKALAERFEGLGGHLTNLYSPYAIISEDNNKFGKGINILSNAIVENNVIINDGVLINNAAIISHDSEVGSFSEICPGAKVLGGCQIGDGCSIGTNAVILPKVQLGDNVIVGAGAVVTKNVTGNQTVIGIPAR